MKRLFVLCAIAAVVLSGVAPVRLAAAETAGGQAVQAFGRQASLTDETLITLSGSSIVVTGSGVTVDGSKATITAAGAYRATGTLTDGWLEVNAPDQEVTLTLDGVDITHSTGSAISGYDEAKLSVVLAAGTANTLVDGSSYSDTGQKATLFSNDTLEVTGSGALTISANYKHGVASDDDLILSGGDITVTTAVKDGFHANDHIDISGGTIQASNIGSDGFESEGTLLVEGGVLSLAVTSDAIKSASPITVTNGTIDISSAKEGIEGKSTVLIDGGSISAVTSDYGIIAATDLTINDGEIYANAAVNALHSNGTLSINGGTIVAVGGSTSGSGLASGEGYDTLINGGTIVATGATNTTPSSSSTQHIVILPGLENGDSLDILRDDDVDVLIFESAQDCQSLLFSSAELLGARSYTSFTGGTISGGTSFHGLYSGATYSSGSLWIPFTTDSIVTVTSEPLYLPLIMRESDGSSGGTEDENIIHLLGDSITATSSGVTINGTVATINAAGTYTATGTLTDGKIDVDTTGEVELILDGVTIAHSSGPAISVTNADKLSLVLNAGTTNSLTDGTTYTSSDEKGTLFSNDSLEISGDGSLTIVGQYKHGIVSDDDLSILGGNITIASTVKDGFHANDHIGVSGGTIQMSNIGSDGFESEGTLTIDGGTFDLDVGDDGIMSQDLLTINAGTISISGCVEGIESKYQLVINGGDISIIASDDGLNAAGNTAVNNITINDGQLYINATADAVDSNGTMTINGGLVVALGGNVPEGGLDCDDCKIALNGGILVATGGANSSVSTSSGQHVAILTTRPINTIIHITRNDSTDVLTFKVSKAYQQMIFTSPLLLGSRTYTVSTGGTVSGGTNFHGLYTGSTYSGGTTWTTFTTNSVVTYVGGGGPP